MQKLEFLNSELKNALFGCLGQQFWKTIVIFEISTLEFCKVLCKKIKILIFGTKNARFAYFGTRIWKYYCHIWNRHPQIWVTAKFCEIIKIPKLGIKNALFGYFWAWILKNYCHIWNHHPRICLIVKFCKKWKCLILGTKMPFWVFLR